MNCLPFGLSSAPKTFASVSNCIAQILRQQGIRLLVYIDDFLLANRDVHILKNQVEITLNLLSHLGWRVNLEKSTLTLCRVIEYLGISWDRSLVEPKVVSNFEVPEIEDNNFQSTRKADCHLKTAAELNRLVKFCQFCCSTRKAQLPPASEAMYNQFKAEASAYYSSARPCVERIRMVDVSPHRCLTDTCISSYTLHGNRRFGSSLGSTNKQYSYVRNMIEGGEEVTRQLQRIANCTEGLRRARSEPAFRVLTSTVRQQNSGVVSTE